eukprot:TRINITY_DN4053_c0_g1_i1.p1 TRINITY_DN4053_c0_g1~~TRINITY_DN4053_c0_g1_i1.p1  ORF type:complete len:233 (-),score=73.69 TRINITY_DN4053_c0_g1_i1:195-893(-)
MSAPVQVNDSAHDLADAVGFLLHNLAKDAAQRRKSAGHAAPRQHPACAQFAGTGQLALSIESYVVRIAKYTGLSRSTMIAGLIYIDRLLAAHPTFEVSEHNLHRLLLTCCVISQKNWDDRYYLNKFYASVGGISTGELNALEVRLLSMLSFQLNIDAGIYEWYQHSLVSTTEYCRQVRGDVALAQLLAMRQDALKPLFFSRSSGSTCAAEEAVSAGRRTPEVPTTAPAAVAT